MKSITKIILALMILISSASAQSSFTKTGTVELGGDIAYANQTTAAENMTLDQSIFSFDLYYGTMAAPGIELGIRPSLSILNTKITNQNQYNSYFGSYYTSISSSYSTVFNFYFAPSYNINTHGNAYPYFEFLVGAGYDKEDASDPEVGLGIGGDAGVKIALGNSLLLFKIEYVHQSYGGIPYLNTVSVGVGFRMFTSHSAKTKVPVMKGK